MTVPFLGLGLFTIVIVAERWPWAQVGLIPAILVLAFRPSRLQFPAAFWWAVAFVAWAFLGSFAALSPDVARDAVVDRIKAITIFLVVVNTLRTPKQLRLYLLIVIAAVILYPVRGALLNYSQGYTLLGRAVWNNTYANPNDLGAISLLTIGAALAIGTRKAERVSVRWLVAASAVGLLVVALLTQSRGSFLGLTLGFGPPLLTRVVKRPSLVVYVLIAASVALNFVPETAWHRLATISKLAGPAIAVPTEAETSAAERLEIQKTAWRIFADHPVFGVGLGCYPQANALYSPFIGHKDTHDTYLNLAAEVGAPGLLLWLALVTSVLRYATHCRKDAAPGDLPAESLWIERGIYAFLVAGVFGSYSGRTIFYVILGTLWCAANLAHRGHNVATSTGPRATRNRTE